MKKTVWILCVLVLVLVLVIPTSCCFRWCPPPPCVNASIQVVKYVSVDHGVTWFDANSATGSPEAYQNAGVKYKFVVTNTGDAELSNVTLTDSNVDIAFWDSTLVSPLPAGQSFTAIIGFGATSILAKLGTQINTATATGEYNNVTYKDTDVAWYTGIPR